MRSSRRASASAIRLLARCQIQWCGSFISCTQRLDTREFHAVKDHVVEKTPITAQLWQMRKQESASDHTSGFVSIQASIVLKTVEQSRLSVRYSFRENSNLRDLYVDHTGNILIGKLFEDMDALAGNVAIKHCCDGDPQTKRLSLVTASLDEIIQKSPIPVNEDIILTGNRIDAR